MKKLLAGLALIALAACVEVEIPTEIRFLHLACLVEGELPPEGSMEGMDCTDATEDEDPGED